MPMHVNPCKVLKVAEEREEEDEMEKEIENLEKCSTKHLVSWSSYRVDDLKLEESKKIMQEFKQKDNRQCNAK